MCRTPSPLLQPGRSRSATLKGNGNRVQKHSTEKKSNLDERMQNITANEFVKFFQLRCTNVVVYIGSCERPYNLPRELLCQKSHYFRMLLESPGLERIHIEFATKDAFQTIIQNMYTDKITLPNYESQFTPSKVITKYLEIIRLTSKLELTSDFLPRNAATAIWAILRTNPSKFRDEHLEIIFSQDSWPKGWAYENLRNEFVKNMAEEWLDITVRAGGGKTSKYDLEGLIKNDGEVAKLVLAAVGEMLKKRAKWTGVHPLTGKSIIQTEEKHSEAAEEENGDGVDDEEEMSEIEEVEEAEEAEEGDLDEEMEKELDFEPFEDWEDSPMLTHTLSERGRWWEITNKHTVSP